MKMTIAMFGHKRLTSREGGIEVVAEALSTRMAALGHGVICYDRGGHHVCGEAFDPVRQREHKGVRIQTVPTLDRKGLAAVTSSFFAAAAAAFGPAQVVHIHGEGPAAMAFLPRWMGKRVVVTVHGLDWKREKWGRGPGAVYLRWGEKMAVRHAHAIIVLTDSDRQYFLDAYRRETTVIPNGITLRQPLESDAFLRQNGLNRQGYLLFVGRLVPEKGIHHLIRAYRNLKTEKKLVIVGGGSDCDDYVRRIREQAQGDDRILFAGFLRGQPLEELYSHAWLCVFPSSLEGMPLALLEAMSYGKACVASDLPACRETAGAGALYVPPADPAALEVCLQRLLADDSQVRELGLAARQEILKKWDWDRVTEETLALYRRAGGAS